MLVQLPGLLDQGLLDQGPSVFAACSVQRTGRSASHRACNAQRAENRYRGRGAIADRMVAFAAECLALGHLALEYEAGKQGGHAGRIVQAKLADCFGQVQFHIGHNGQQFVCVAQQAIDRAILPGSI